MTVAEYVAHLFTFPQDLPIYRHYDGMYTRPEAIIQKRDAYYHADEIPENEKEFVTV